MPVSNEEMPENSTFVGLTTVKIQIKWNTIMETGKSQNVTVNSTEKSWNQKISLKSRTGGFACVGTQWSV